MSDKEFFPPLHLMESRQETRNDAPRAAHVQDVLAIVQRTMHGAPSPCRSTGQAAEDLVYATGLTLGVRSLLVTLEEWKRWGECAAALLWARYEANPVSRYGAGAEDAGEGER